MAAVRGFNIVHALFLVLAWECCARLGATFNDVTGVIGQGRNHRFSFRSFGDHYIGISKFDHTAIQSSEVSVDDKASSFRNEIKKGGAAFVGREVPKINGGGGFSKGHEIIRKRGGNIVYSYGGKILPAGLKRSGNGGETSSKELGADVLDGSNIRLKSSANVVDSSSKDLGAADLDGGKIDLKSSGNDVGSHSGGISSNNLGAAASDGGHISFNDLGAAASDGGHTISNDLGAAGSDGGHTSSNDLGAANSGGETITFKSSVNIVGFYSGEISPNELGAAVSDGGNINSNDLGAVDSDGVGSHSGEISSNELGAAGSDGGNVSLNNSGNIVAPRSGEFSSKNNQSVVSNGGKIGLKSVANVESHGLATTTSNGTVAATQ